ncbi:MAG: hypothetical protein EOM54_07240 [Clostridia bacterium]|nr:hypothetical protein [Clostridia bacterium]
MKGEATEMNLTNEKVHHRQFGDGVVTDQTTSTVTVQFSEEYGEKRFLYPSAFESFLILNSPVRRETMNAELRAIREQLEAEFRRREEEAELRREEEKHALLEQKRAAAKKRTPAKKLRQS